MREWDRFDMGQGDEESVLESLPLWPCFAAWELRSRSACLAAARGSFCWLDDILMD